MAVIPGYSNKIIAAARQSFDRADRLHIDLEYDLEALGKQTKNSQGAPSFAVFAKGGRKRKIHLDQTSNPNTAFTARHLKDVPVF